jgi:hypothetical protein
MRLWPSLRLSLRRTPGGAPRSSCPSSYEGQHQISAQQEYDHDNTRANEHFKISRNLHANQETYKEADDSEGNLTLGQRAPPLQAQDVWSPHAQATHPIKTHFINHSLFHRRKQEF